MEDETLPHSTWVCKYHIIWIPKYRKKKLFEGLRTRLGEVFHELARQKNAKSWKGI